jgi:hypothetical protein
MVLFPDVQKRVQAELDAVVGRKRLPTFEDRASLPYLEATIKESLRFHPPTPLGIAHRLSEEDVVQGKKSSLPPMSTKLSGSSKKKKKTITENIVVYCRLSYPKRIHNSSEHLGDEHERETVRPSRAIQPRAVSGPYTGTGITRVRIWPTRVPGSALFHRIDFHHRLVDSVRV